MKEIKLVQFELKASHGCFEKFKKCDDLRSTKEVAKKQVSNLMQLNLKNSKSKYSALTKQNINFL